MDQKAEGNERNERSFFARHPIGTVILLVFFGACTVWAFHLVRVSRSIAAKEDAIRQAGYPLTLEELDAWYEEPPEGQNAADKMMAAFDAYVSPEDAEMPELPIVGSGEPPDLATPLPSETMDDIAKYLALNEECLALIHEASDMPRCRYPVDLTLAPSGDYPHLANLRAAVRLLQLQALWFLEAGDMDGATETLVTALRVGQSLREEPLLISQFATEICLHINLSGVESVLNRVPLTTQQLDALCSELSCIDLRHSFARAFAGERCLLTGIKPPFSLPALLGLAQRDRLFMLGAYEHIIDASQSPSSENQKVGSQIIVQLMESKMPIGISHILLPSLLRALETPTQGEAHRQVTLVALAVERFRAAHGTLPKSLEELAPTGITVEITDPYDGSPLRYIPRDSEFIVYSVGSDQKDDGGTPGRRDEGDIVFTVRRAAAPAQ